MNAHRTPKNKNAITPTEILAANRNAMANAGAAVAPWKVMADVYSEPRTTTVAAHNATWMRYLVFATKPTS